MNKTLGVFIALIAASVCLAMKGNAVYAVIPPATNKDPVELNSEPTSAIWDGYTQLKEICSCESWGDKHKEPRQFLPDGSLLRGYPNPDDVGACQINTPLWGKIAQGMGFDIDTYAGNIAFAKWLYDEKGSQPWNWSKGCWSKM